METPQWGNPSTWCIYRGYGHGDGQLLKHLEVAVRRILPISPFPKFNTLPVKHHSIVSVLLCVFVEGSNTCTLFRYSSTVSAQSPNSRINPCTCQHTQQPAYATTTHTTQLKQQDCSGQQAASGQEFPRTQIQIQTQSKSQSQLSIKY